MLDVVITAEVAAFKSEVEKALADGFQYGDAMSLLSALMVRSVKVVQAVKGATGAEKKEAVLSALETFWSTTLEPMNLPWVADAIVDPLIRKAIRPVFGALIDGVVMAFWAKGIFA